MIWEKLIDTMFATTLSMFTSIVMFALLCNMVRDIVIGTWEWTAKLVILLFRGWPPRTINPNLDNVGDSSEFYVSPE